MVHQALVTHRAATMPTNDYCPELVYVFGTKIGTRMGAAEPDPGSGSSSPSGRGSDEFRSMR